MTRSDVFSIGREFPVSEVSFTGVSSDLAFMKTEAQAGHGIYFDDSDYGKRKRSDAGHKRLIER